MRGTPPGRCPSLTLIPRSGGSAFQRRRLFQCLLRPTVRRRSELPYALGTSRRRPAGLCIRSRPCSGRDLPGRHETTVWAELGVLPARRSAASADAGRGRTRWQPGRQHDPEHGHANGGHASGSPFNSWPAVSASTRWRTWSSLGQCVQQSISLSVRPLLRSDEARVIHDRACSESIWRTPKWRKGLFLELRYGRRAATTFPGFQAERAWTSIVDRCLGHEFIARLWFPVRPPATWGSGSSQVR